MTVGRLMKDAYDGHIRIGRVVEDLGTHWRVDWGPNQTRIRKDRVGTRPKKQGPWWADGTESVAPQDPTLEAIREVAPVQGFGPIPWPLHVEAWREYHRIYDSRQNAETIADRGGFHAEEMDELLPGWREKLSAVGQLRERAEKGEALLRSWLRAYPNAALLGEETRQHLEENDVQE